MKRKFVIPALLLVVSIQTVTAQETKETASVEVNFTDKQIFLGEAKCFNYVKQGNDFTITDSNNKEIIKGIVRKNLTGGFESLILFVDAKETFTNKKIVGRNDLILALVKNKVIDANCRFDMEKLSKFIKEYDGK